MGSNTNTTSTSANKNSANVSIDGESTPSGSAAQKWLRTIVHSDDEHKPSSSHSKAHVNSPSSTKPKASNSPVDETSKRVEEFLQREESNVSSASVQRRARAEAEASRWIEELLIDSDSG